MDTLWLGLAGALGTIARYHIDRWIQSRVEAPFPCGTLTVNVLGSFLLAVLMSACVRTEWVSPHLRWLLATGVLGGFTTYSAFNLETLRLLQEGATGRGVLYVGATLGGCLAAGAAGWALGRAVSGG